MARKRKKIIIIAAILILVAGLLVLAEFLVTRQAEKIVKASIKSQFKLAKDPEVHVTSHPILIKLALGNVDHIDVKAENVATSHDVTITDLSVSINGLRINMLSWIQKRRLSVQSVDSVFVTVVLSEKEVNRYLSKLLPGSTVKLLGGKIRYHGKIGFLAGGMKMDIRGRFTLGSNNRLTFIPELQDIEKMNVAPDVKQYLSDALTVDYALPELPGGFKITSVVLKPGKIVVKGKLEEFDFVREEIQ